MHEPSNESDEESSLPPRPLMLLTLLVAVWPAAAHEGSEVLFHRRLAEVQLVSDGSGRMKWKRRMERRR